MKEGGAQACPEGETSGENVFLCFKSVLRVHGSLGVGCGLLQCELEVKGFSAVFFVFLTEIF